MKENWKCSLQQKFKMDLIYKHTKHGVYQNKIK